ncbi:hypothetical protein RhiirA5_373392 [Rhizophagus irregularis]|uniref:Uncharacterized protein n=1 Tax=Rhizophagus irregularis TaxID=588596 RepID=A0A2N0PYW8_9GLOM|nr:hypothetical protein RhiirA5_373392 [Rhizophagus irregularis]CAB5181203.1 unnamed protein product [Rhizophagus irregularis]
MFQVTKKQDETRWYMNKDEILIDLTETKSVASHKSVSNIAINEVKDKLVIEKSKERIVTPLELHEYEKVNADCAERKVKPLISADGLQSEVSSSSDDEVYIKEVKKRIKKKQGTRSDEDYEESEDGGNLVSIKVEQEIKKPVVEIPASRLARKTLKGRSRIKKV